MDALNRRLTELEKKIGSVDSIRDARLAAALRSNRFDARHLDALYRIVRVPLRAAALCGASWVKSSCSTSPGFVTGLPMMDFACVLGYSSNDEIPEDVSAILDVLRIPEDDDVVTIPSDRGLYDDGWEPDPPGVVRGRRGLIQRLVDEFGLDNLRAAVPSKPVADNGDHFPTLPASTITRMKILVKPLRGLHSLDFPLVVCQDEKGKIWQEWAVEL